MLALSLAGLAACAAPKSAEGPIPAEVARRLETVRGERTAYPDFAEVPAPPAGLRTPAQWAELVGRVEATGAETGAWPRRNPAWLTDPVGDARRLQALTAVAPEDMPRSDQHQLTEAFAESLRQRVAPPPPID